MVLWVLRTALGLVKRILLPPCVVTGTTMRLAELLVMLLYVVWSCRLVYMTSLCLVNLNVVIT